MFRKGLFSDIKINDSTSLNRLISSPPEADSTHIESGYKSPSGKLTPKRRAVSPIQNSKGISKVTNFSPVLSRKIDPQVFTDVQSRGLASRIVKYHEMNKQNERSTLRSNYTKPGEFPIVNLSSKKELPYVVKRNLSSKNPPVRIAPPDKTSTNLNYRSSMLRSSGILIKNDNEPIAPSTTAGEVNIRTRSVLDELTEISRKRINNEELKIDSIKKTCIESNGTADQSDSGFIGLGGVGLGGNKKRQRDTSFSTSPTSISPTKMDNLHLNKKNCILNKKPSAIKNNDILSSLSSSMIFPNAKLNRNSKNTISHPNSYNTNNVFIQSIERQYQNRLPSFDAQPSHANKSNLIQASSCNPVVPTTFSQLTSKVTGANSTNVIQARVEPPKPATQKLLLFNRPDVPKQHTIKITQPSEDTTVSFVKPKQIIDNNLIIEPSKINENSLVKRKSNLTGIERSKLAMMLEYLKSDDEDDGDKSNDEIDNKTLESAIYAKPNLSSIMTTVESSASSLSLPLTTSTSITPQTLASNLPTISSETFDKSTPLTTIVTTVSALPVMTSKIETSSTINNTQNTPPTSLIESIVTPNVTTIETKSEFLSTVALPSSRIGGFSFPLNPASTTSKTESSISPISSSSDTNTKPSFSFDGKINPIETQISFSPITSVVESQPQTNQTFSFFNKPNTTAATTELPAPQPNMTSSPNVSSHQSILPTSLINFSSPQKNSTATSKPLAEEISFINSIQPPSRIGLNVTFGEIGIPTTTVKADTTIVPATTSASRFSFTANNSISTVNSNFSEPIPTANMFTFNTSGYTTTDLNSLNKPKVQTNMSTVKPCPLVTTESTLFMQNVPTTSVSAVKPFSFSATNVTAAPILTENSMFNNGNQQNKSVFGNFPTSSTTGSAFTFGDNGVSSTEQNNGFGNSPASSTQQNNVFGTLQAPSVQPNNVFGNPQVPATSSNNSETTLFNFKTANTNNTTNQPISNSETTSNVFKLRSGGISNSGNYSSTPTSNVFGGSGMQQKNDIFGGGMINNTAKPAGGVFNFTTTTTQANSTAAPTFLFPGINKNQPIASNANVFGSLNTEQPKSFGYGGGGSTLHKIQTPPTFGSNDTSKSFTFGQPAAVTNSNITNKPPAFGTNMFANSNTDTEKLEPSKSAFGFGSPNSTQSQPPAPGMFSFSNNNSIGTHSNNNMNAPTPVFGQAPAQAASQNPFSIGPGGNSARRPVRTAMRRLNK